MNLIVWEEKYSVHVARFDEEHKQLVRLLNSLIRAVVEKRTGEVISPILNSLIVYTQTHFRSEEKAMREYAYPAYLDHLKEHEDFTQKVIDFQKDFLAGKALVSISILKFLYDWLLFHIQGSDAKYSAFFNQKGLR